MPSNSSKLVKLSMSLAQLSPSLFLGDLAEIPEEREKEKKHL
jgi:hypothetical protein